MKRIAYTVSATDTEGRGPFTVIRAFWSESERDESIRNLADSRIRRTEEIVDVPEVSRRIVAKLSAVERLVLGEVTSKVRP